MDSKSQSSLAKKMVLPLVFFSAAAGADVTFYGHVNRAALYVNDDHEAHWMFVDNDNSATRLGVKMSYEQSNDMQFGGWIEYQLESNSSSGTSQATRNAEQGASLRHADAWISNPTWGKLSLGQGSTASDGTFESSFTGTAVVMYNTAADFCGGWYFHPDGSTSRAATTGAQANNTPTVGTILGGLDGLGRLDRLRYDTPTWYGFSFAASAANIAAEQFATDVAIRYSGDWWNMFSVKAAIAHAWQSKGANNLNAGAAGLGNTRGTNEGLTEGSFAIIHNDTGWNGNFAIGSQQKNVNDGTRSFQTSAGVAVTNTETSDNRVMWSVEIGKQSEWISCGNTNVSVQYMHSKNSWINRDSGSAWGVAAVQHMDRANTELYAAVRTFDYKNDFQSYDNIWAMMVGLRVKFSAGL